MAHGFSIVEDQKLRQIRKQLRALKLQISDRSKKNFELERDVRFFDQRIALLISHRISIEEFSDSLGHGERRVGVIKDEMERQLYGNLFFLLQTEPYYLAQLTRVVSLAEIDALLQSVMFSLYGNQYEAREEHLLLSMFELALKYEFQESEDFNSLLRANTAISRMMTTYTRRGPGQEYLKHILEAPINELISQQDLILEINPVRVYMEIHECVQDNTRLTTEKALDDIEVQKIIKVRLRKLEEVTLQFLSAILQSLDAVPYGIRWLCSAIKDLSKEMYPKVCEDRIASLVGGFFLLRFINPAIVSPYTHMLVTKQPKQSVRRNLTLVAKILQSMANKTEFSIQYKEQYMQPLQPFVTYHQDELHVFLDDLSRVPDFHELLEMEQFLSLPKDVSIDITLNEMYGIHRLLESYRNELALTEDDPLNVILDELPPVQDNISRDKDLTITIPLFSRWDSSPVVRSESLESTLSRKMEKGVWREQCKQLVICLFSKDPQLMEESTLEEALQKGSASEDSEVSSMANFIAQRMQTMQESNSFINNLDEFYDIIREEIRRKMLKCDKLLKEVKSLESVHKTLCDQGNFLKEQLDAYREYLVVVRNRAASKAGVSSPTHRVTGPLRFPYVMLEKEGVIIESEQIADKKKVNIFITIMSPEPGVYKIGVHFKGQIGQVIETDLHLEDLLELQHLRDPVLNLNDCVVLDVKKTLLLLHKHFTAS